MRKVKDLGLRFARPESKRMTRYALYECPQCKEVKEMNFYNKNEGAS